MNQIAVVQGGKVLEREIVLPSAEFDALKGSGGYRQRANRDLERVEGSLVYVTLDKALREPARIHTTVSKVVT